MEGKEKDILDEYRKSVNVTDDEIAFITSYFKISKINYEMEENMRRFGENEIDSYEALLRLDALLELMASVRNEVKAKL